MIPKQMDDQHLAPGAARRDAARSFRAGRVVKVGALIALGGLIAIAFAGVVMAPELPEPLERARSAAAENLPGMTSNQEPRDVIQRAGDLAAGATRASEWLRSRGVEPVALPAAAQAYRQQYGHGLDEDLGEYGPDIEEWLTSWQAAYNRGEPWARGMVEVPPAGRSANQ